MADTSIVKSFAVIDHKVIDEINILQASLLAMKQSIEDVHKQLVNKSDYSSSTSIENYYALVDGNRNPYSLPMKSRAIVKGDSICYCIALASIIAKVERDRLMDSYGEKMPQYGFSKHKGYPTRDHTLALHKYGPSEIHRLSFKPLKGRVATRPVISAEIASDIIEK